MTNSSKQSIFTSRFDQPTEFPRATSNPTPTSPISSSASASRIPRIHPPFRRQSSSEIRSPTDAQLHISDPSDSRTTSSANNRRSASSSRSRDFAKVSRDPGAWQSIRPERSARGGRVSRSSSWSETQRTAAKPSITDESANLEGSRKRTLEPVARSEQESQHKRLRFRGPRTKHTLDPSSFVAASHVRNTAAYIEPPSPLFFSPRPHPPPNLPPRFSSSEAGARMLSKARTEDTLIKTVSLARGTIITPGASSASSRVDALSRRSLERSVTARSSSPHNASVAGSGMTSSSSNEAGTLLGSIGVIELLEQDERPTFVIDLADSANYGPGSLQTIFANGSLRACPGLYELVSGIGTDYASPGTQTYLQFKSWLLSAAVNGESLNVCLPSFVYANITWSCSTIRKRLRVIGGAFNLALRSGNGVTLPLSSGSNTSTGNTPQTHPVPSPADAPDYFGSAMSLTSTPIPRSLPSPGDNALPSTETPTRPGRKSDPWPELLSSSTDLLPNTNAYVTRDDHRPNGESSPMDESRSSLVDESYSQISTVAADAPSFDWTRLPLTDSMPQHIHFARSIDWSKTALGPIEEWSADLRQMCNLIMASPHPAAMYWGESLTAIYNEAYIILAGQKHPRLMGMPYHEAWTEIWDDVKDVFAAAKSTGEATMKDDDCLFIKRNDYLEETYFSWSIIPMVGQEGTVMGLYNPAFEKTRRKIAERRMLTLREIGERTASARDVKGFWSQVVDSFDFNEYDSPLLLLYSVADEQDSDSSSIHSNSAMQARQCTLEGSLGTPPGHPAAPLHIDLRAGMEGFGPVFREAMKTDRPVYLEVGSRDLPHGLVQNLDPRGFGDPVRSIVVCPIHPTTGENILGFLVLGINPRRPYDDDYSLFVQLLSRQLATSLASVVLFEEEIRRGQRAARLAALDRIELSEQLAARTQEAIDSETKFTRMAEFAPVGMFIVAADGCITFANDTWYEISRVPKVANLANGWMDAVNADDRAHVQQLWQDLVVHAKSVSCEFRFKSQWEDRNGMRGDTWVLFSAYPETYVDGRLKSAFGSITNISPQKWAEGIQTRKMEEAVELKRQQENFIDITSHEMRNPLSAILQCSDEITTSLTRFRQSGQQSIPDELVSSCLDAAQIINLCSQHQKRIVDDILTLSKLDSQLLLVTPVDAQPLMVVQRALKMHESELQAADIQMKFVVDQSYSDLKLDWLRFDPSRVMQVLINLTTNAIKFTGSEKRRTISVTISASRQRPSESVDAPVKYFPSRSKRKELPIDRDWGDGEKIFVHFSVTDTGRGLSPEEKKMLFLRFSQASPRTHVQYGGSGLGLFISRELTELQGGEIGVESESGKGSTFAFYVEARRSQPPPDPDAVDAPEALPSDQQGPSAISAKTTNLAAKSSPNAPLSSSKEVKKVLIVEDNLVNQRVLQKQLKNLGTEVHLANHGGEALEKLRQSTFWSENDKGGTEIGIVLMDLEMPVMDGLTAVKKIRELEREHKFKCHVPIIAVTANARSEQVQTAMNSGMDDVVSKPFRIPELIPKIEQLMRRYPMPRPSVNT